MRLDKYLSDMNFGSRKEVKSFIKKGLVSVNGQIIKVDKFQVKEDDEVNFKDEKISYQKFFYYLLNKPKGVVSATKDNRDRTVLDLLVENDYRKDLFPVGRLDKDTEGFLLLTNDGDLSHRLLSPKSHVAKDYQARVRGIMTEDDIEAFSLGLEIDGGEICLPAKLIIESVDLARNESTIRITLYEGKFHQVKRMVKAVGKEVIYLKRLSMGGLNLDEKLELGTYRPLSMDEVKKLEKGE